MNRREDFVDTAMNLVEYLAVLVSPHPKETLKVIDERRRSVEREKLKRGEIKKTEEDSKLFKKDHRNTTFYDDIAKFGGADIADLVAKELEEGKDKPASVESYDVDVEDLDFIQKAREMQEEIKIKKKTIDSMDRIEF